QQLIEPSKRATVAAQLLRCFDPSQAPSRFGVRSLRRETLPDERFLEERQMRGDLARGIAIITPGHGRTQSTEPRTTKSRLHHIGTAIPTTIDVRVEPRVA